MQYKRAMQYVEFVEVFVDGQPAVQVFADFLQIGAIGRILAEGIAFKIHNLRSKQQQAYNKAGMPISTP